MAEPRKIAEYVLIPDHNPGKDRVLLDLLGYRPRSQKDAVELAATYVQQAERRWRAGDVVLSRRDEHGPRYVIEINLRGVRIRTVWVLRPSGERALVTPFRGFARDRD